MKQIQARILKNKELGGGFYRLSVESKYLAKASRPGQFVQVKCSEGPDPLLRRPLGIHRVMNGGIELLYEMVGRGTELLANKKEGELLDVIGPLGTGFNIMSCKKTAVIVAGGNGVAPLMFLAETLIRKKKDVQVLIGGCSQAHILCEKQFKEIGAAVKVATEDGSLGHKGLVTDLITNFSAATIYACGPTGMLKAVAAIAGRGGMPCQVSLEEHMACGVGVCLGCPVRVHSKGGEYKMVCKDGPVFDAEEILW